jgi:DCN1-like protein 1/2
MAITGAPERVASRFLKASAWKLDVACDGYFQQNAPGPGAAPPRESNALALLFEKYRDIKNDEKDTIGVEGTMAYFTELGVNLESGEILVPLEIIQAQAIGEITKEGFVEGWKAVGLAETIAKQKSYVASQIKQLSTDIALFKRVYKHTFVCSKEKGQKALALENAIVYWQLLFSAPGKPWVTTSTNWLNLWIEFLTAKWTKSVNKDMWNQTFEFFNKSMQDESLGFWSEDGAWPGVIDEFVAYTKEKRGGVPESMETD